MTSNIKIVFFGTPIFAVPVLKGLIDSGQNVVGVFASPGPVEIEAHKHGIKTFEKLEQLEHLQPNLCVVAAYGKIIPARYLSIPKYGFLNIHPSILPKYRGPSPVQTAILNGDTETGVTIIVMNQEIDHGPILSTAEYKIPETKYNIEIATELFELGAKLLLDTIPKYISLEVKPQEQDHALATFTKKFTREDARIDWQKPTKQIYNQIRALNPEPGTWTTHKDKILKIKKASIVEGKIMPEIIQLEGKKEMTIKDFLNGHSSFSVSDLV